jgi:hypothetical protein
MTHTLEATCPICRSRWEGDDSALDRSDRPHTWECPTCGTTLLVHRVRRALAGSPRRRLAFFKEQELTHDSYAPAFKRVRWGCPHEVLIPFLKEYGVPHATWPNSSPSEASCFAPPWVETIVSRCVPLHTLLARIPVAALQTMYDLGGEGAFSKEWAASVLKDMREASRGKTGSKESIGDAPKRSLAGRVHARW